MPLIVRIEDPADPRIEPYRDVRERDLVGRRGGFIAEGEVVLNVLLRSSRHRAESLLLAEKRLEPLLPLLERLPGDVPVHVASQAVLDTIAGFHLHRGILAFGRRAADEGAETLLARLPERALVVAAFGIGNHDNIGGIFRNAAAFGAQAVLLDPTCCDPLYRKAIRVSVGAALSVPFARIEEGVDAVDLLRRHGFETLALSPAGGELLARVERPPRAAVLLGAEGPGLPAAVLSKARTVSIPMAGEFDSLNVATACGIALHHFVFG
ncbi:MAG TPA: RNA methyltransferase [Caulobacteraceae bacterium]